MDERVARLEADVGHIKTDIADMKIDIRRLGDKIDRLDDKVDRLDDKVDGVKDSVAALSLQTEKSFATFSEKMDQKSTSSLRWMIGLQTTIVLAMLGAMAGGFLWLAERLPH